MYKLFESSELRDFFFLDYNPCIKYHGMQYSIGEGGTDHYVSVERLQHVRARLHVGTHVSPC